MRDEESSQPAAVAVESLRTLGDLGSGPVPDTHTKRVKVKSQDGAEPVRMLAEMLSCVRRIVVGGNPCLRRGDRRRLLPIAIACAMLMLGMGMNDADAWPGASSSEVETHQPIKATVGAAEFVLPDGQPGTRKTLSVTTRVLPQTAETGS